jgi:uncharacterized YigZ family protein
MTDRSAPPDHYAVFVDGEEVEFRVKGSRFAGQVFAAPDPSIASRRLDAIRKRYHDATHHCWAHQWGRPGHEAERSDDDGEPSGTAGVPILRPLAADPRHDGLLVVTRWFGGTKLGTGGLIRAYGEAAQLALEAARSKRVWRLVELCVECDYADLGAVEAVLARAGEMVHAVRREYEPALRFEAEVRRSAASALTEEIIEATAARARVRRKDPENPEEFEPE